MSLEQLKVLVVDDDFDFVNLYSIYLRKHHRDILLIPLFNPIGILKVIQKQNPDVIICDYEMPNLNGLQVLHLLMTKNLLIPFILCTAKNIEELENVESSKRIEYCIRKNIPLEKTFDTLTKYVRLSQVPKKNNKKRVAGIC